METKKGNSKKWMFALTLGITALVLFPPLPAGMIKTALLPHASAASPEFPAGVFVALLSVFLGMMVKVARAR